MLKKRIIVLSAIALLQACGGGSSENGMLIEGSLIEAGGAGHRSMVLKHQSGQPIENVKICTLGECSVTDGAGLWGIIADESFTGGRILITVDGHGILAETTTEIEEGADHVVIELRHVEGGKITARQQHSEEHHD